MLENDLEREKLIWDEYKYRHAHIWKTIFSLTGAMVLLSVVPYIKSDIIIKLPLMGAPAFFLPPALSIVLWYYCKERIESEMDLLRKVKDCHRKNQKKLFSFTFGTGSFDKDVNTFLSWLLVLAILNIGFLVLWFFSIINGQAK